MYGVQGGGPVHSFLFIDTPCSITLVICYTRSFMLCLQLWCRRGKAGVAYKGEALPAQSSAPGSFCSYSITSSIRYLRSPVHFSHRLLRSSLSSLPSIGSFHYASLHCQHISPRAIYYAGCRFALALDSTWLTTEPISCPARRRIHATCMGLLRLRSGRLFFF